VTVEITGRIELEARLTVLEQDVARRKSNVVGTGWPGAAWWERVSGNFADDPAFEKVMKLGRETRGFSDLALACPRLVATHGA
jgi:hypothetical protein